MDQKIFSKDDYEKMLHNVVKNPNAKFISAKLKPLSEDVEGFVGEHYKILITYELNGTEIQDMLFVKTTPLTNKSQAAIFTPTPLFDKEIFFYEFLLKEFEKHNYDTSFAAKSFYSTPDKTLVLEDLSIQGFKMPERCVPYDMAKMKCLLKAVALVHAAGFAYDRKKSEELGKEFKLGDAYPEPTQEFLYCTYTEKKHDVMLNWWKNNFKSLEKVTDLLQKDEKYKSRVKQFLKDFEFGKIFVQEFDLTKTLGHGDLWSNNMMFKFEDNVAVKCKIIDYQVFRYSYPAFDVVLAIYFNTNGEFRKKYLNQLYEYYYSTLSEILQKYGCEIEEIFPLKDYYSSIDIIRPHVLMQVASALMLINLPKDIINKSAEEGNDDFGNLLFENEALVVAEFKKSQKFRDTISTAIHDLYESMEGVK